MVPGSHPSLRPKRHVDRFSRFCTAHRRLSHYFTMGRYVFPQQLPLSFGGSGPPSNIWYVGLTRVINANSISIVSAVFVWVPNAMLYNSLSMGKKTPQIAPSPVPPGDCAGERQSHTDTQTDVLITILCHRSRGRSNQSISLNS